MTLKYLEIQYVVLHLAPGSANVRSGPGLQMAQAKEVDAHPLKAILTQHH